MPFEKWTKAAEEYAPRALERIVPTCIEADLAFCTFDTIHLNTRWNEDEQKKWEEKRSMWKNAKTS